jgi:NAD(P)-dependent dehydrogenase (short-subunit alcohol dehydrogenase family)
MTKFLKVALVTGAGTGIGKAAAMALHNDGFALVLVGRRIEPLEESAALLGENAEVLIVPTDISDAEAVAALFAQVRERFGRLDVLFNNAGSGAPRVPMEDLALADWNRCVNVNLNGAFMCSQEAMRIMKAQTPKGGRIINNGSVSAHSPRPDTVAYTSTKHAITGLTRSISLDGRKNDIACSQIDIGNADTPLGERFKHGVPQANGDVAVEPVFDVEHCGSAVAFMAGLPLDTNVQFMTIMATKMPFIGRG